MRIYVEKHDEYVIDITDEEFEQLENGDIDIDDLIDEKGEWKNGYINWD